MRVELPLSVGPVFADLLAPKPFRVDQREFPASEISENLNFRRSVSSGAFLSQALEQLEPPTSIFSRLALLVSGGKERLLWRQSVPIDLALFPERQMTFAAVPERQII